ncbi:MAG: hypothetical protein COY66_01305 [Candidatus Kerfeldbacteria bacterium CG_4_10_14_0_8_um_filter_42_10]|uniref:HypC/HybG/HupF family hydrogenase formation chaperone n=1 Tax=Candidatus Kerfeldbacteria bacterium CG_4_10_14_0_8_um_filter_42_10 TaxID=2014248 RepID=A0A2M7RK21_9BACT|nr:MAG: hypothetical protein COY66_01305 [Candidatus Kerfeldbacteria bacterium CG_4_10_14_0_8_um_filter_42_10]
MCITIPAKIIQKNKNQIVALSRGRKIKIKPIGLAGLNKGSWILVYGDIPLKKISEKEANEIEKILTNDRKN